MQTAALGYYVAETTNRASWSATIAAAEFVPTALLAPFGGALADRMSRKRLLLAGTLIQAILAAILTAVMVRGDPGPGLIAVYALMNGIVWALAFPALQTILPDLVPADELTAAIGLSSANWNLGRVIGPALGGIVYARAGIEWVLAVNALSFGAVVVAISPLALPDLRRAAEPILASIRTGWRFVRTEPGIRVSVLAMSANTLLTASFIGLIPAVVVKVFHETKGWNAALITAQGLGAVVTGVALGSVAQRLGVRRLMVGALCLLPGALVLYGLAPEIWMAVPAIFLVGMLYFAALQSFTTIAQRRSPSELRGRVLSVNNLVLGTFYPIGLFVQGALGDTLGLREITVGGAMAMWGVLLTTRLIRPGITASVEAPLGAVTAPGASAIPDPSTVAVDRAALGTAHGRTAEPPDTVGGQSNQRRT
jgi:MFS family permease